MKAVILAGGKGTRMRPLTYTRAKPMMPFLNKPVLEHIINKISGQGYDDVILTVNYMVEQIEEYFGDGSALGVDLRIINEGKPLGTAGCVKNACGCLDDTFAVIQGDNMSEIDVGKLYKQHKKMGGLVTICLMEVEDASLFGIAEMKGDEIVRYKEKPKPDETFSNLANAGIYIIEPEVLDMIPLTFYDFSKNLFPKILAEGKKICGVVTHDFWRDVGKPQDYLEATHYFLKQKNLIADGCSTTGSIIKKSVLGNDCGVANASITDSVLFDNVFVEKNSKLKHCIIGSNCVIGENVDIWPGAVIGDNVEIGKNSTIRGSARVGPNLKVGKEEVIEGVIVPDGIDTSE